MMEFRTQSVHVQFFSIIEMEDAARPEPRYAYSSVTATKYWMKQVVIASIKNNKPFLRQYNM